MELRITPVSNFSPSIKLRPLESTKTLRSTSFATKKTNSLFDVSNFNNQTKNNKRVSLRLNTISGQIASSNITEKKGVLLYQQIERNKIFSEGTELVNRFHFKV